jgi:glycosyltransferase involved in cell wall biosynthesis
LLLQALDSVFAQTFSDYEVIVVDDGSTDDTETVLRSLIENKMIIYAKQAASGVSAARNRGVSLAKAQLIAFLDSDDLFLPSKLMKQVALIESDHSLGFVHCNFSKFDNEGKDLGVRDTSRFQGEIYPDLLQEWSVLMAMPCMLMRKAAIEEAGGFDESMTWAEDLDLWRRIAMRHPVRTVPEALVKVRVHATSTTFGKVDGADGFERYLAKAFDEDPKLDERFKRRAKARMHTKLGQNLLGEGGPAEMKVARVHSIKALAAQPLQLSAALTFAASFLPRFIRGALVGGWRKMQYPKAQN